MDTVDGLVALQQHLEREREAMAPVLRFMLLDHVEHLLSRRRPIPPIPRDEALRAAKLAALRRQVRRSLGLLPFPRRSALQARSVGRFERPGYAVEKIIFHARPGFAVPALLYSPADAPRPLPAVLYASGHSVEEGMLDPDGQCCCIALARLGFAVLAYEAMGQGERGPDWEAFRETLAQGPRQSPGLRDALARLDGDASARHWLAWAWHCLHEEHGQLSPLLVGLSQEGLMVWESMRALDYLSARKDVDPGRLAVMGASGGGQNAYYTAALDPRVQVAISICCLPSLAGQIRLSRGTNWWGGGDLCDQTPLHLTYAEYADVGALIMPRPLLFVAGRADSGFPLAESRAEHARLAAVYDAAAPGRLRLTEVDGPHGISRPMREAAYGWLARWLQGRGDGSPIAEPPCEPEPAASPEMRCLPPRAPTSSRPALLRLSTRLAGVYARRRQRQGDGLPRSCPAPELLSRLNSLLGPEPEGGLQVERVSRLARPGLAGELLALRAGPEVRLLATMIRAEGCAAPPPLAVIVHDGYWRRLWEEGWIQSLAARGCDVAILDTRGTGPGSLRCGRPADRLQALGEILQHEDEAGPFVTDFEITSAYLLLGRSLLGERAWDLRHFVAWVRAQASPPAAVACLGVGQGGLVAILAAAADPSISAVATWRAPVSFRSLIMPHPAFPPSSYPFGVLRHLDLPEVAALIAPRPVTLAAPCDGQGRPVAPEDAALAYRCTRTVYESLGAPQSWQILAGCPAEVQPSVCERLFPA